MKEALSSSETSVLTRATRRNIPEDAILHERTASTTVEEWCKSTGHHLPTPSMLPSMSLNVFSPPASKVTDPLTSAAHTINELTPTILRSHSAEVQLHPEVKMTCIPCTNEFSMWWQQRVALRHNSPKQYTSAHNQKRFKKLKVLHFSVCTHSSFNGTSPKLYNILITLYFEVRFCGPHTGL
jgi:hypothetical protein